jgi:hypothetical protein
MALAIGEATVKPSLSVKKSQDVLNIGYEEVGSAA